MTDLPDEDSSALRKRRAIQALMKDPSLSPVEKNQRMMEIMRGKFDAPNTTPAPPPPPPISTASLASSRRGSAFQANIEKFTDMEKHGPPRVEAEEAFSSVDSVAGRGHGLEEAEKLRPTQQEALLQFTAEEKKKRAFIPSRLYSTNRQVLEERVKANSPPGKAAAVPVGMEEFEARIRQKGGTMKSPPLYAPTSGGAPGGRPNDGKSIEQRILAKSRAATAAKAGASPAGLAQSTQFEQRVMEKARSNSNMAAAASSRPLGRSTGPNDAAVGASMSGFDERLARKMSSMSDASGSGDGDPRRAGVGASASGSDFHDRLRRKASTASEEAKLSESLASLNSFEARLQSKTIDFQPKRQSKKTSASKAPSTRGASSREEAAAAGLAKSDRKRESIAALMQDHTLDAQERNQRLSALMAGDWDESEREGSGVGVSDSDRELSEHGGAGLSSNWKTLALEAKIAAKMSHKHDHDHDRDLREEDEQSHTDESHGYDGRDDDAAPQSLYDEDGPGEVGFGSLPLPEEHFAHDQSIESPLIRSVEPQLVQDEDDENFGLAVAQAVAPDDEPDYVYNAVEYDPFAKPPLHRNRRFRVYTYFALILIGIMVILVVVYVTSASKGDQVVNKFVDYQDAPSRSPTSAPITDREESGIIEQLEGGVLLDGETFEAMERGDPRFLALDWILHLDMLQLVSDDPSLYQRFALAVMAYSLDSRAWFFCGDAGENYTESVCSIVWDENTTETHGIWLSSTPECGWYGVICSGDGIVRGVDLNNNDLIGTLPKELYALSSLQLLALPHNCLYGPIPPELGKLRHLLSLELHGNGLSGEMPKEMYSLEKLQLLNLANQWGVQRECNATNGQIIDINYRMGGLARPFVENAGLTGTLGPEVGIWRSMKGLYLNKNSFVGSLADEIGNLRYLRFLAVNDNFIEGTIPSTVTKLRNLRHLQLGENFLISSLPSDLGRMTDLEILTVNGNSMTGDIPQGLYKLTKLEILRLDETLEGQAPWFVVPDEGFTGSISTLIGGLQDLRWLVLSNNPLTGTIPTELGLCEKLEVVRVHRTNIEGTMPWEVCLLRDMELNNEGNKGVLYADCRPTNKTGDPFLKCGCCSDCCDHATGVCIADD